MTKKFVRPDGSTTINQDSRAIAKHFGYTGEFIRCEECKGNGTEWINYSVGTVRCPVCRGCGYFIDKEDYHKFVKPHKHDHKVEWHVHWSRKERRDVPIPTVKKVGV